jgi:xanthine dehydrogenase accessory factor
MREPIRLAAELLERRQPFVLATVVWRRAPSSGQRGSQAVITPDGTLQGWLGGACAEPTLVRAALQSLEDGQPRLLFLGQMDELDDHDFEGVMPVPMACENEGALEVYLEPMLPPPHVVVLGHSPAATTLGRLAEGLGWTATVIDTRGDELELGRLRVDQGTAVVVATQGHDDERALEAALATDAGYVGLVASRKRAHFVLEFLGERGVSEETLARVRSPAGLDLGRIAHEEIAVAILAELVQERGRGGLRAGLDTASAVADLRTDPVCGMDVDPSISPHHTVHDGHQFWFCAATCKTAFERDPDRYLPA